jgi:predicted transcriptional regulator of viral defense system
MKSSKNLIEQLKLLPYFSKKTIHQLGKQFGLKNVSVDTYISRFLKRKEIIQLKKGLYVAADFFNKNRGDISYSFYLANILRTPSYVSSWTALQYYNLTTESIYTITSITPKVTRTYKTKAGTFAYQSVKKELFSDFSLVKGAPTSPAGRFDFFIAFPAKALFDLLYLKTHQFRGVRFEDINKLVEEMRIDIEEMDEKDRAAFYVMIKKYLYHE